MFCRKCGTDNADSSKFCCNCGSSLQAQHDDIPRPASATTPSSNRTPPADASRSNPAIADTSGYEKFSPAQAFDSSRVISITAGAMLALAAIVGGIYYFSHRGPELAEIAKTSVAQPAAEHKPSDAPATNLKQLPDTNGQGTQEPAKAATTLPEPGKAAEKHAEGKTASATSKVSEDKKPAAGANDAQKHQGKSLEISKNDGAGNNTHGHKAKFKGPFGIIVEKRTYPTEEMKQKALALWEQEKKILEPDGSINDKYVVRPAPGPGLIPGH